VRHRTAIALLVVATILLGVLAVGTPVAGNDSVAAVTAGINLGTSPTARTTATTNGLPDAIPRRAAFVTLLLLLALALVPREWTVPRRTSDPGTPLRSSALARRGPPAI